VPLYYPYWDYIRSDLITTSTNSRWLHFFLKFSNNLAILHYFFLIMRKRPYRRPSIPDTRTDYSTKKHESNFSVLSMEGKYQNPFFLFSFFFYLFFTGKKISIRHWNRWQTTGGANEANHIFACSKVKAIKIQQSETPFSRYATTTNDRRESAHVLRKHPSATRPRSSFREMGKKGS
jgi:hypothetical protein